MVVRCDGEGEGEGDGEVVVRGSAKGCGRGKLLTGGMSVSVDVRVNGVEVVRR